MAKLKLGETAGGFLFPEGWNTIKITQVDYDETFGKIEVHMEIQTGQTYVERFFLVKKNGEPNPTALNIFTYLAKTALNKWDIEEIDTDELEGTFFEGLVEYQDGDINEKTGRPYTNIRFAERKASAGWSETEEEPKGNDALSALLAGLE